MLGGWAGRLGGWATGRLGWATGRLGGWAKVPGGSTAFSPVVGLLLGRNEGGIGPFCWVTGPPRPPWPPSVAIETRRAPSLAQRQVGPRLSEPFWE